MLQHLVISNYALIDNLEIDFKDGLTIITGETGAGKSILLGALGLIVGDRSDIQALQDKSKKCVVEGIFKISDYSLRDFFKQNNLDYEAITTVRREINPEGKSRAFINDTPVTLTQLKEFGTRLIDIHSQHETLSLNDHPFQLSVVDAYAQHSDLLKEYGINFKVYKDLQSRLNELTEKENQSRKEIDYYQFQFNELEDAELKSIDQQSMEQELKTLNNAEEIKGNISKAFYSLNGGEENLLGSLKEIKLLITGFSKYNSAINELDERLNSSLIELKDIAHELEKLEQEILYDPQRIEELTNKLDSLYRLQQKHQVKTVEELLAIKDLLSNKLLDISSLETQISKLKSEIDKVNKKLSLIATKFSENRSNSMPKIEKEIKALLSSLSIPDSNFKIEHSISENLNDDGMDKIKFLFSANKGNDLKELNKVVSGGELSRLMLSLKYLIAELTALPTIIFDEIDTGVSGNVADKVGNIMNKMAFSMQVITITHLPQIAGKGSAHLFVYKEVKNGKTYTSIKRLNKEERVQEIAKMLSTENPTTAAIKNARELLKVN